MSTSNPDYVGIDWDSGSWLAVSYTADGEFSATAESDIGDLWDLYQGSARRIVIDVPIGLCRSRDTDGGACRRDRHDELVRPCDKLARSVLDPPRSSSVFNAPARGAVEKAVDGASYARVSEENEALTGKGLTQQSAGLAEGICAVDRLLEDEGPTETLVEGHPEVCFRAFAGQSLRHSKKTAPGVAERLTALESTPEYDEGDWREIVSHLREEGYVAGLDDVLDAIALAVTARASEGDDLHTLPTDPETDTEGRPMQMVYRRPEPFVLDEGS